MIPTPNLKFIDLFAGIGGFRIALEKHGAKCVFTSEWDKEAQKTYSENFGEVPQGDITKINEKEIPNHDIICAGFPCQAFSISGKQQGFKDARGTLFFDIARIAKHHQPKVLFLENVKNLVKHYNGNTLKVILRILDEIGYDAYYGVLVASHYGVPQARERIYIVAFRKDLGVNYFYFPKPMYKKIYLKDILEEDSVTAEHIINRKDIRFWEKDQHPQLKPIQIGQINNGGQGERIYSINGHAITLSAYGGGAAGKTGAYLVNGKIRRLSPRECARVQGFPEWFKIPVSRSQAYKQFGNSISVPVVEHIYLQILKVLNSDKINELKSEDIPIRKRYDYTMQTQLIKVLQ
ncbi:MAG: DNA cytosine methyltransferase [Nanoarchaeota archaeon]|nr:DNA cytosine methyltransferase [Nanoarchaeota archaeon]MBU1004978.1 DNA cytosine methyltransferase [Nanoarchaeota archaeon]MBU1946255.1 DNA cytosine methyltransferase [Nanoarchaeota archaeon]